MLSSDEILDLTLLRDNLRTKERLACSGQEYPAYVKNNLRDWLRVLLVIEKLLGSVGPPLAKHEEP